MLAFRWMGPTILAILIIQAVRLQLVVDHIDINDSSRQISVDFFPLFLRGRILCAA